MSTTPRRIGKYELQKQLGRGSAGEVWKGYDLQLRREVAVKLIHPDLQSDPNFMTRFVQEGEAVTALRHTNIVQIREASVSRPAGSNAPVPYLIMDYVEGQTLADYIDQTARVNNFPAITDIAYLFASLGSTIDYLHENGVIDGNIKPGNILLDQHSTAHLPAGEPMLTDFAIGKLLGNNAPTPASPFYLSPEQAKGHPAIPHSDIYSLGIILYELCTGKPPFRGESPVAVMMQHLNILPTPPTLINPNVPPALSEVILRALAKDPATRYPTASLLASAIAEACSLDDLRKENFHRAMVTEQARWSSEPTRNNISGPLPSASILGVPVHASTPTSGPLPFITPSQSFPAASVATNPLQAVDNTSAIGNASRKDTLPVPAAGPAPVQAPAPAPTQQFSPRVEPRTGPIPQWNASPATTATASTPRTSQQVPIVVSTAAPSPSQPLPPLIAQRPVPPRPPMRGSRRNMRAFYLVSAAVLLILAALLGTVVFIHSGSPTTPSGTLAGHVFFQDDALGHDDVLRIELQGIPPAPQGQEYVGWLELQNNQLLPLHPLTVNNGSITWVYPGTASHTNLLATAQGFSLTLENSGSSLQNPAGVILYEGRFEQTSLPYIKNILNQLPGFPDKAGVLTGMFNTIKSINDKANSIDDTLQVQTMHDYGLTWRQAIRIIELIDGSQDARTSGDLPANDPSLLTTSVGLISSNGQTGYLDALAAQVNKIHDVTQDATIRQHAQNVQNAITDLRSWVQNMRTYDIQLLQVIGQRTDVSPAPPSATLLNLALQLKQAADDSYTGRTIPPNGSPLPILGSAGAYQAYTECQYMATLNVKKV